MRRFTFTWVAVKGFASIPAFSVNHHQYNPVFRNNKSCLLPEHIVFDSTSFKFSNIIYRPRDRVPLNHLSVIE
jgi:hypothetical protein